VEDNSRIGPPPLPRVLAVIDERGTVIGASAAGWFELPGSQEGAAEQPSPLAAALAGQEIVVADGAGTLVYQPLQDAQGRVVAVAVVEGPPGRPMPEFTVVLDREGRVSWIDEAGAALLGVPAEGVRGVLPLELLHEDDVEAALEMLPQLFVGDLSGVGPVRVRHESGAWRYLQPVAVEPEGEEFLRVRVWDVTDFQRENRRLAAVARRDSLTGLVNRTALLDELWRWLRARRPFALYLLDLDDFRIINDSLGHRQGDRVLQLVAERLAGEIDQEREVLARLEGDEFALLTPVASPEAALAGAEALLRSIEHPLHLGLREFRLTASIGLTHCSGGRVAPAEDVLDEADLALHAAKRAGKARAVRFEAVMRQRAVERLELGLDLQEALSRGEIVLGYHPIVDLYRERIVGVEALLRWNHPQRGRLGPQEFITLAEESGLIVPIGAWAITRACAQAQRWRERPDQVALLVSVNLSPRQLEQPDLVPFLEQVLAETGLPPPFLQLEITETLLMHSSRWTIEALRALRDLGVQLAVDDFGTGYSSLSYLQEFPVTTLKIDRAFVSRLPDDPGTIAIVRAILALGNALGLEVMAEGIEREEQVQLLRQLGCRCGQGYFFAEVLAPAEMEALFDYGLVSRPAEGTAPG
jgi:diguanylate cyclase (GGDEF)-like protein